MYALKQHLIVVCLVLLAIVELATLSVSMPGERGSDRDDTSRIWQENIEQSPVLKISEIRGPRIDDEAAMIEAEESFEASAENKESSVLPRGMWVFLLVAYVALLIFNFSYTFKRVTEPQWVWETALTALVLIGWVVWDKQTLHLWFPFIVVKLGLIVFISYIYLLERKKQGQKQEEEVNFASIA